MKPTDEQLIDPKWWDENAPEWAKSLIKASTEDLAWFEQVIGVGKAEWLHTDYRLTADTRPPTGWTVIAQRPTKPAAPEWDEDGEFPPVGEKVEACVYGDWQELVVSGYGNKFCIGINGDGEDVVFEFRDDTFRPLRTKEQREREELSKLVREAYLEGASEHVGGLVAITDAILSKYNLEPKND